MPEEPCSSAHPMEMSSRHTSEEDGFCVPGINPYESAEVQMHVSYYFIIEKFIYFSDLIQMGGFLSYYVVLFEWITALMLHGIQESVCDSAHVLTKLRLL